MSCFFSHFCHSTCEGHSLHQTGPQRMSVPLGINHLGVLVSAMVSFLMWLIQPLQFMFSSKRKVCCELNPQDLYWVCVYGCLTRNGTEQHRFRAARYLSNYQRRIGHWIEDLLPGLHTGRTGSQLSDVHRRMSKCIFKLFGSYINAVLFKYQGIVNSWLGSTAVVFLAEVSLKGSQTHPESLGLIRLRSAKVDLPPRGGAAELSGPSLLKIIGKQLKINRV